MSDLVGSASRNTVLFDFFAVHEICIKIAIALIYISELVALILHMQTQHKMITKKKENNDGGEEDIILLGWPCDLKASFSNPI